MFDGLHQMVTQVRLSVPKADVGNAGRPEAVDALHDRCRLVDKQIGLNRGQRWAMSRGNVKTPIVADSRW